jgi:hypothetical protein
MLFLHDGWRFTLSISDVNDYFRIAGRMNCKESNPSGHGKASGILESRPRSQPWRLRSFDAGDKEKE